ncbi:permease component of an ABC superfamily dipeptide transporter [Rahnella aquatilis CIP 78.65 = ATCC 33071]|uniref:ABC-type dipeptide/oligopeptide/nickel transport system, permease component n=1 Tax=Rahnella aquatilis (strain ATCC 33071 / DSM 4594 / JCM 1683 / NBRC 105701 / NCIMB 13365 / CIP 78.65) TaxID=745277 RepID=H2J040_RAHAC|nr:ABC transporter permease [Rahnella aquatilis]AEX52222.1 ABC-type dipeptide/oligopeptide/nickel transport system, permease component [Rahnella aquatilis CIP 78.65 = ATCC 33071]KFD10268.1 permease component of an ABC superfamily dipeptide transporter [Rahnella aquatilis CIP 78.65 = ATCC 33071]
MSTLPVTPQPRAGSRAWLLADTPQTRTQAVWGRRYRIWLGLRKNPLAVTGLFTVLIVLLISLCAPWLTSYDPGTQDLAHRLAKPSSLHWLGTDELGRDTLSRILYGGRITLGMVIIVVAIVAPLGLLIGCVAGYAGGLLDRILMRITDIFLAFPRLILALAFVAALKPGIESAILAIALTAWPPYARLARAETMQVRGTDYIAACRLTGATPARIVLRHVMPLCVPSLVVRITLDMSSIIITAASLGFLGMGAQPPSPEWGAMIATARRFLFSEWWVPLIPSMAIFITSLAFNFLGDGLRDVLDPKEQ